MVIEVVQIVTVVALMLGLFWQQQRVSDKLETKMEARLDRLETKMDARFDEVGERFKVLETKVGSNGERLARIEGRLEIMPTPQPAAAATE